MLRRRLMLLPAACVLGVLSIAAPAAAADTAEDPTAGAHCALDIDRAASNDPDAVQCFDSFAATIHHVTGGAVTLPDDATTVSEEVLQRATGSGRSAASGSVVVATVYDQAGYEGSSFALTASSGCGSAGAKGFPRMSAYDWDNRVSSAKVYSGCRAGFYRETSYSGTRLGLGANGTKSSFGSMDNRTSSIRLAR